jgi:RNA polymerase sigma factor (sigma-70 family)
MNTDHLARKAVLALPASGDELDHGRGVATQPAEYAQAALLAQARAALTTATLSAPNGITACLRVIEVFVHRWRLSRRALLLESPTPPWIEPRLEAIHAQAGCRRDPLVGPTESPPELFRALAQLPWSGEWLMRVWPTLPGPAAATVRPVAEAWVTARNAFVEGHRGLVASIARRYGGRSGLSQDDLIQEGCLALCRAVERYEPGRGTRFSSYAVPALQRAMAHAIRQMGTPPAAPPMLSRASVSACPLRFRDTSAAERNPPRPPTLVSLDAAMDGADDARTLAERLTDPNALLPDESVMYRIEHERLRAAFGTLPSDVQHVLVLHWGLDDGIPLSVHQIGRLLDRPVEEIRDIVATPRRLFPQRVDRAQRAPSGCTDIGGAGRWATFQSLPRRTKEVRRFGLTGLVEGGSPDHE